MEGSHRMTDTVPRTDEHSPATLGAKLRAIRQQRGLSLADVAAATNMSASFLSLVETGKNDITVGRLSRLVQFFGVSALDLLPDSRRHDAEITRTSEQHLVRSSTEGIEMFLMTSEPNRNMLPMLLVFKPGASLAEAGRHAGEEFVFVLEGELLLEVSGSPAHTLKAGDSAYYAADRPHQFSNPRPDTPLRLICVDSPPAL